MQIVNENKLQHAFYNAGKKMFIVLTKTGSMTAYIPRHLLSLAEPRKLI